jgi:hypothetical protein
MGFSLDSFFNELFEVLDSDISASRKCRRIYQIVIDARQYAKECGMLDE